MVTIHTCRYFQCEPKHGLFAPLPKIEKLACAADSGECKLYMCVDMHLIDTQCTYMYRRVGFLSTHCTNVLLLLYIKYIK